ncbi:MAG: hypothetical protein CMB82_00765 [Flammeovirgaceae bacterium]|nr:hypothetical protein [Flammeovirgaceae bacterium]
MNHFKNILLCSFICSIVLFTNCGEDSEDVVADADSDFIYLDENGITIKASENAVVGKNYKLNGVSYLIVDKDLLAQMIAEGKDITKVITSRITDMVGIFYFYPSFNQDISSWDVSNVNNMSSMFYDVSSFNQNISNWDVSNVTSMFGMFTNAFKFNQDIGAWDVSNVSIMALMFKNASTFNQDLSSWAVSNVTDCREFSYETTTWALPKPDLTNCTE